MVKAVSGGIEPATLRRKTFSGHGLELVVSLPSFVYYESNNQTTNPRNTVEPPNNGHVGAEHIVQRLSFLRRLK